MLGKNQRKKLRKTFFLYSHEYRAEKWGKKRAKQFFQKHTYSTNKKCCEKIEGKKCEKRFLYSHEYRDKNIAGQKRVKQIIQKNKNRAGKKNWEKISSEKIAKKRFFI